MTKSRDVVLDRMSVPPAVLSAGNQQAIAALLVACIQMIDYGHPNPILIPDLAQGIKCSAIDITVCCVA